MWFEPYHVFGRLGMVPCLPPERDLRSCFRETCGKRDQLFSFCFHGTGPNALTHLDSLLVFLSRYSTSQYKFVSSRCTRWDLQAVLALGTPEFLLPGQPLTLNATLGAYHPVVWKIFAQQTTASHSLEGILLRHLCRFSFEFTRSLLILLFWDLSRLKTYTGIPLQKHELQDGIRTPWAAWAFCFFGTLGNWFGECDFVSEHRRWNWPSPASQLTNGRLEHSNQLREVHFIHFSTRKDVTGWVLDVSYVSYVSRTDEFELRMPVFAEPDTVSSSSEVHKYFNWQWSLGKTNFSWLFLINQGLKMEDVHLR